jgi:hypothetical protein
MPVPHTVVVQVFLTSGNISSDDDDESKWESDEEGRGQRQQQRGRVVAVR